MICSLFPPASKKQESVDFMYILNNVWSFLTHFVALCSSKSQNSKSYYFEPCYVPQKANVSFTGTDSPKKHWTSSEAFSF